MGTQLKINLKYLNYISRRVLVKLSTSTFAIIILTQIMTNFLVVGQITKKEMAEITSICFLIKFLSDISFSS